MPEFRYPVNMIIPILQNYLFLANSQDELKH